MVYSTGVKCNRPLSAAIDDNRFTMRFARVPCCDGSHYVETEVICAGNGQSAVTCDWQVNGFSCKHFSGDTYHRADLAYCEGR